MPDDRHFVVKGTFPNSTGEHRPGYKMTSHSSHFGGATMKTFQLGVVLVVLILLSSVRTPAQSDLSRIRESATRGFALIQATQKRSRATQSCTATCHLQLYGALAYRAARERDIALDERIARSDADRAFRLVATSLTAAVEGTALGEIAMNEGFSLVAGHAVGLRPSVVTAAVARAVALQQKPAGDWPSLYERPPSNYSSFTFTALALRALQLYGHPRWKADTTTRTARARQWLRSHDAHETEERTYQLLGLAWAGEDQSALKRLSAALGETQQDDGGWNSLRGRPSDAYSTGQALVALHDAGGMSLDVTIWRRGIEYLLRTQESDGSWHVATRLPPWVSPSYFESGYPHGRDQFISVAAANWATMALVRGLGGSASQERLPLDGLAAAAIDSWVETVMFGTVDDLRSLLDRALSPNAATSIGRIPLLSIAMPDADKVKLLLDRGADVNARSDRGYTPLLVGAQYQGSDAAIRLLLDRGAKVNAWPEEKVDANAFPIFFAAHVGNAGLIPVLRRAGAIIEGRTVMFGGGDGVSALDVAAMYGHDETARALLKVGANPNGTADPGPLVHAIVGNRLEMVRLLIASGADVNRADTTGMTPLMYAAATNFGDPTIVDLLLKSGARLETRGKDGVTAADLARKYNKYNPEIVERFGRPR
jgi:ankyrin repeat protein